MMMTTLGSLSSGTSTLTDAAVVVAAAAASPWGGVDEGWMGETGGEMGIQESSRGGPVGEARHGVTDSFNARLGAVASQLPSPGAELPSVFLQARCAPARPRANVPARLGSDVEP
uniref:Uncharacterized protein n=1 Tax=Oryza meridionalis TaxID=40149 RepID=A0A0E0C4G4_9ORYZ